MDDVTHLAGHCPQCSRPLAPDAPQGLCVSCLLTAGMETLTVGGDDQATLTSTVRGVTAAGVEGQSLTIGERWGDYRIGRLLGRGGMGEVYEAEHVATGRRLALKVLRSRLHSPDDRARFLREGQLAASVSHPHTVYIFGSDEIAGMPVITMELLPGGTLKDRIVAGGPLPPAQAVAAILDIIGGLDAAQASGILHRDIKPSNCFIDRDGTVKVGDFGLSISTLARDVREDVVSEGFQGTPQFAAPEQLRGEPLDVRADVYAVGATLYYLLTGRPPFAAQDLRELVTRVTTEPAPSPRTLRPEIPPGLAAVVVRCLAKTPAERPPTYAALAEMLRPFTVSQDVPAPLISRAAANVFDSLLLMIPAAILGVIAANPTRRSLTSAQAIASWAWAISFLYFLLLEGRWGASLGKRALGLHVVSVSGAAWWRIPLRTTLYYLPSALVSVAIVVLSAVGEARLLPWLANDYTRGGLSLVIVALLFSPARRRNGWAAWQDLLSGTRVVLRRASGASRIGLRVAPAVDAITPRSDAHAYGPYRVVSELGATDAGRLLVAFDPVLRRRVWIHAVPDGTPPVDAARRDVARAGRLYWLAGRRATGDSWDAFEAPDGGPLVSVTGANGTPMPWAAAKLWLADVATELAAAARDTTLPPLSFDRVWRRDDGRVLLLDFRPPKVAVTGPAASPSALLGAVAGHVLRLTGGAPEAMPLSARQLLQRLSATPVDGGTAAIEPAHHALAQLASGPDTFPRWRRLVPASMIAAPLVAALGVSLAILPALSSLAGGDTESTLRWLSRLSQPARPGSRQADPEVRVAMEQYVARHYRAVLADDDFLNSAMMQSQQLSPLRRTALDLRRRYPSVSDAELVRATNLLAPELAQIEAARRKQAEQSDRRGTLAAGGNVLVSTITGLALLLVLLVSLASAALVPGGLLARAFGLAVVRRDGSPIGRFRSVLRVGVAWLPGLAWLGYLATAPRIQVWVPAPSYPLTGVAVALGALLAGAVWTTLARVRGPHDRIMGTWVTLR